MAIHIIIDGYNLIRQSIQWQMLDRQDMQLGRDALIEALAAYKRKKPHRITVVFDGADAPSYSQHQDRISGIAVKYSGPGETADTVIKRMASHIREQALVVSSDRDVIQSAARSGAATIGSPEFEQKVVSAAYGDSGDMDGDASGWEPTTRKKGPSRRLPKRNRKNRSKLKKL
ncbi:MAG: NYN domain-containing protein [Deltaproteobacteria bacterium]|nr:NYN domain-containing protein [Deltaproteobacteria bacterium]